MPPAARVWIVQENSLLAAVVVRIARRFADCRHVPDGAVPPESGEAEVVILVERALREHSHLRVAGGRRAVLATVDDDEQARDALERGAEGVVEADSLAEDLPLALDALLAGRSYLSPTLAVRMGACSIARAPQVRGGTPDQLPTPGPAAVPPELADAVLRALGSERSASVKQAGQ